MRTPTKTKKSYQFSRGVTAVEAAIIMPFFLTLVYGIIYLALYLTVQGILDTAATRALTTASTSADLEVTGNAPPTCEANSSDAFCEAIVEMKLEIKRVASTAFVAPQESSSGLAYLLNDNNPVITWPLPSGSRSYEQVLQTTPITITVTANLRTFLPFMPSMKVVGRAAGFREIRKALSYPVVTDCNGYPIGHALYKQRPCSCSTPNSAWNPTNQACEVCNNGRAVPTIVPTSGAMIPPGGFIIITPAPAWNRPPQFCACPSDATCSARHGPNAILDTNSCKCRCIQEPNNSYYPTSDSTTGSYETCRACPSVAPAAYPPAPPGGTTQHVFTGYQQTTATNGTVSCGCVAPVTQAQCNAWFPGAIGRMSVEASGCRCTCTVQTCAAGGTPGAGAAWMMWWNPGVGSCNCGCFNEGETGPSTTRTLQNGDICACNTPCAGIRVRSRDADCDESTCRCPATTPCPAGQIKNDDDINCGCIPATSGTGS